MTSWLEQIRLRSPEATAGGTRERLERLVEELGGAPNLREAALYSDAVLAGDFSLHLVWVAAVPARKTETGHLVAEHLRGYGLVDHRAWKPERTCPRGPPSQSRRTAA
jgi:hypothetical protein